MNVTLKHHLSSVKENFHLKLVYGNLQEVFHTIGGSWGVHHAQGQKISAVLTKLCLLA